MTQQFNSWQWTTLIELLEYRASEQPDKIAYTFLVDGETEILTLTYQQLNQQAQTIAAKLQAICQPQDRVLLLYQPGLDYISAFFGCLYAGVIAVPAYPPRPDRSLPRLQAIIGDTNATVALTTEATLSGLQRFFPTLSDIAPLNWLATDLLDNEIAKTWQRPVINRQTLAFLQYTSGSTATPKGVMISHQNLLHNLTAIYHCFGHSSESTGVIWLPPYHDMGLIGGVLEPLFGGFPVVLMSPLMFVQNPLRWLQTISRYRGTTSGGPNFAYDLCVRKVLGKPGINSPKPLENLDLSSWEVAFNGAEPIYHEVIEKFIQTFAPYGFRREAFYPCYGMAEATLIITGGLKTSVPIFKTVDGNTLENHQILELELGSDPLIANPKTLVGCGQCLSDQTVLIVNPETLNICEPGKVGEIWVAGPSVGRGYWNKPQETEMLFNAYLTTGEGPFLRTGDLGFLDDQELFITGRIKDIIIINGRNHYPQDIEWTVEQSHPLIKPSGVAGFSIDRSGEERLVLAVEVERQYWQQIRTWDQNNGSAKTSPKQGVLQSIRRAVSQNHDLQVYQTVLLKPGTLPKTSSGKIQRHACRASFIAGKLGE
ncbi:fatty acyl-AMP ligase [Planktothrix paucivesiculata]|uniref:Fatty-acid--CoA ligase (Acyl-CoA synthetase) n=1 Tax=Planktothrix paucivesiculata PCC 9631 TaxID=671071 RepID=A0A7Z9E2S6_9CYAN|nr:fatty acyl-AMP ligase [Planktothrix paucivesiculata]VXD22872.1 Putative fatty-acid--CoA ligase (Acyl-CoA synthetase) [Planktothrix paucivesiculata PCC 9631]